MKVNFYKKKTARIEMLPLIDIVFLLLVVFIYSMLSMSVHHGMPVILPKSSTAKPETKTILSVTVKSRDKIYIGHNRVDMGDLSRQLRQSSKKTAHSGVLLFAQKDLPYQVLFNVLDEIKQAGHTKISLQARLKQDMGY